ncbi:MAG: PilT/PilU family type 4a pilus ATPase [Candidatus Sumerlaeota bacterium]|nr:PilT/PilU family type 4a pilus ATPase [Candidatus Sumerlaeota bacterium]
MSVLTLNDMLAEMVERGASDLYLAVNALPSIAVSGKLESLDVVPMEEKQMNAIARGMMDEMHWKEFLDNLEVDMAYAANGERFRVNVYFQRATIALVARHIRQTIPKFEELNLPEIFQKLSMFERGLELITGATGSGKSTTLASMIDWRNQHGTGHIVTVEDPVEFVHEHKQCIVSQREVGLDTKSFHMAIRSSLRQAPRVILIGEVRDTETAQFCLHAAETGHLVFSTLHTNNANQTLDRLLGFFPALAKQQALLQLSLNLRAIVSQRLVPKIGGGRVVAIEILLNTARVQELIERGEVSALKEVMAKGYNEGMQTFDLCLYHHVKNKIVTEEDALRYADSANDLKLRLRGLGGSGFA